MNRLILVGNGFDLAHGLKTDYNSFIVWYLTKCFTEASEKGSYEDELIKVSKLLHRWDLGLPDFNSINDYINYFYSNNFDMLQSEMIKVKSYNQRFQNPFQFKINSRLMSTLLKKCSVQNWVDIENEFYELLKKCNGLTGINLSELNELNISLRKIIEQLELYLNSLPKPNLSAGYSKILKSYIEIEEIFDAKSKFIDTPKSTLILNFNYTSTIEQYLKQLTTLPAPLKNTTVNYIHGQIEDVENPLIFGFGDELDDDYKKMELSKTNEFFTFIKSFWYFKTSNYHDLIRFIESDEYQIFTLGHSCGLSDRTLLSMIFEHTNCKAIKIYYHGDKEKNDYRRLTQEISRHFKDKSAMRKKITPFDKSFSMPQVSLNPRPSVHPSPTLRTQPDTFLK
nr:AbiH family protein [Mucilaginibacter sp. L294]